MLVLISFAGGRIIGESGQFWCVRVLMRHLGDLYSQRFWWGKGQPNTGWEFIVKILAFNVKEDRTDGVWGSCLGIWVWWSILGEYKVYSHRIQRYWLILFWWDRVGTMNQVEIDELGVRGQEYPEECLERIWGGKNQLGPRKHLHYYCKR